MKKIAVFIGWVALLGVSACSTTQDLGAPCPEYGRYCVQTPVNA